MIGPLILFIGLLGIWAVVKGKAGPVLDAITSSSLSNSLENSLASFSQPSAPTPGSSSSSTGSNGSATTVTADTTGSQQDIGSHQAIVNGVIFTIDKTYAQMNDAERTAANNYANAIGNVGSDTVTNQNGSLNG